MGEKIKLVVSSLCIFQWGATLFGMAYSSTTPMVQDLDRSPEIMVLSRLATALSDFNASHVNNRLLLHPGDSEEDLAAAAAVSLSLKSVRRTEFFLTDSALNLKNLEVQAGPQASEEDDDTLGTGEKAQVTIISFAANKSVTFYQNSNFFQILHGNSSQENTVSAIDHTFWWKEMSKDLLWIRTNAIVNGLTSTSSSMFDSNQAVLGLRTCVRVSIEVENFSGRWRRIQEHNPTIDNPQLNVFGLHGCDIIYLNSMGKASNSTSWDDLGSIAWPGDSAPFPKGWCNRRNVRVGVPVKYEFGEFVTVKRKDVTGYGIDKFMTNLEEMSSAKVSEFTSFGKPIKEMAATYNGLVYQVHAKNFHTVVGDITVSNCTLPFRKSDPTKDDCCSWEVNHWLVYIYFFVFIGSVVWILVKLVNDDFESQTRSARTSL